MYSCTKHTTVVEKIQVLVCYLL